MSLDCEALPEEIIMLRIMPVILALSAAFIAIVVVNRTEAGSYEGAVVLMLAIIAMLLMIVCMALATILNQLRKR